MLPERLKGTTSVRHLLQYLSWMMKVNRTGKLMLYWITKSSSKAASISSNTYCVLLVMALRKTGGLRTFLTAKIVYRITGTRSLC